MTAWLVENMIWASLVMLLVLAIRRPFALLFGAGPAYALWLLPAARLLLPPLPALGTPALIPSLDIVVAAGDPAVPLTSATGSWIDGLLLAWAAGTAAFLAWQWLLYRRFLTRLSLSSRSLGDHGGLPLVESGAVPGPLALGLLDRRIVVPPDFTQRYSDAERRLALDHELVHHRRGDIWCNLAALLVLALNWFNPIAWFAFRAFREDQELACDAAVAARAEPQQRRAYAQALVKAASRPGQIAVCPLNHVDQLKRRLKMMNSHRRSRLRLIGGSAAVVMLAGVSASFGSASIAHPHPEGEKHRSERVIIMHPKAGEGGEHRVHMRHGEPGIHVSDCDNGEATNIDESTGGERTRIVICGQGEANPAQRAEHLQGVRERLANDDALSAEQRARVLAAIDRELARLRGQ